MRKRLIILLCCITIPCVILFALVAHTPQYEPEEGIWICEELKIQLDYTSGNNSYILENGVMIHCGHGSDRGVKQLQVYSQDFNCSDYDLGEMIFCADIKKLTNETMTVFDPTTDQEYIFIRIDIS